MMYLTNCRAFSGPSYDGKIAVLNKAYTENYIVFVYDLISGDLKQIIPDNYYRNISYTSISADSKFVAFVTADSMLYLAKSNGTYAEPLSNKFCKNTYPAFSNNGKYIAFFEGSFNSDLKLKVIDCSSTTNFLVYDDLGFVRSQADIARINWNFDNTKIVFNINYNIDTSLIIVRNITNEQIDTVLISNLGSENPAINKFSNYFVFEGKDGNVWLMNTDNSDLKYQKLSNSSLNERAVFPEWSNDFQKIIYIVQNSNPNIINNKRLYSYDLLTKRNYFLFSNVDNAFWNKMNLYK